MNCPRCDAKTEVVKTDPAALEGKARLRQCAKHGLFWTIEKVARWLRVTSKRVTSNAPPTHGQPPANLENGGGVGGALPSGFDLSVVKAADLNPQASLLSEPRAPARTKVHAVPASDGTFVRCRDYFVRAWEAVYGESYPFEPKDGSSLAVMLKAHPSYGGPVLWESMVSRYFADQFWAGKRHPLIGLATRAREFAGRPGDGLPAKVAASREATRAWAAKETG